MHRTGRRREANHAEHRFIQAPPARHGEANGIDVGAEYGESRDLFAHARLRRFALARRGARLHESVDLQCFIGEVVLHHQAPEVLQQRDEVDHLPVVGGRAQGHGEAAGALAALGELLQRLSAGFVQRAGPGTQAQCGTAHTIEPDHRDGAAYRQHRAAARDLRTTHLGGVDQAQQFERQGQVLEHDLGQFVGALALHQRQACRTGPGPG